MSAVGDTVHRPLPHDSAARHVTGEALYIDDLPEPAGLLHAWVRTSERAHARLRRIDITAAGAVPGVAAVLTAAEVPGEIDIGPVQPGDPVLARETVEYHGQPILAVAAADIETARRAALAAAIDYEDLPAVLDVEEALGRQLFVAPPHRLQRGDAVPAIAAAAHRLQGSLRLGGQEHFYLEGQIAVAIPGEDGDMLVLSSTQSPTEVQRQVAKVLGRPMASVTVEVRRLGGAFGGKETQAGGVACIAALLAEATRRPVKLRLDRDEDMRITGKRHDMLIRYDVGFDAAGRIAGIGIDLAARAGCSLDLTGAVVERAMFHADNAYYLENATITGYCCRTNTVSNTAFRGFGGPQGMCAIEYVIDEIARHLGLDALAVRKANLYGGEGRNVTPYHQSVEDNLLPEVMGRLEQTAAYHERRGAVARFNAGSIWKKRGLALTPVKFGISFTNTFLNQAGALLHVYTDGSVHLNHGGIEMGQGLFMKVAQVVADELGIDLGRIRLTATSTAKVPNTSATAASVGSDLNGKAAQAAARAVRERLQQFAARHFDVPEAAVAFRRNEVQAGNHRLGFAELAELAHRARVPLSATGFYSTPKVHYDRDTGRGRPFLYFAYGAAVSEVEVDTLTGEYRVCRADLLHDCGRSLNPAIDIGQVEGGFLQGMGWLTMEELWWDAEGRLATHAPSTYKIPTARDLPEDFRVELLQDAANREDAIHRSKAVGEPPLMLAISVWLALKDAVAAAGDGRASPRLDAPATPERVLLAIEALRARERAARPAAPAGTG